MKRYFAFGCSYTNYDWLMLPDLIGVNFEKYYNFGKPGACHTFILYQVIQANEIYKFNPVTDFITVGVTGFGRFSFVTKDSPYYDWKTHGDIFPEYVGHPDKARIWAREFDSHRWSVYRSLSSLKTIKLLLTSMNIEHKIYSSVYNKHNSQQIAERDNIDDQTMDMIAQIGEIVEIRESIDELLMDDLSTRGIRNIPVHPWIDDHPTINVSLKFLTTYFPEYNTDLVQQICQEQEYAINTTPTRKEYVDNFIETFLRKYRTDYDIINRVKNHPRYITNVEEA
jgi:hypothetical protein